MNTDLQRLKPTTLIAAILVVLLGAGAGVTASGLPHGMTPANLLGLIGDLNATTNQMLTNTQKLNTQVGTVDDELGQMNTQTDILKQQLKTGANLTSELTTQAELTTRGVSLMQQILTEQKQTASLTEQTAVRAQALSGTVAQSEASLSALNGAMGGSLAGSERLHTQMNQLISELNDSVAEFKLFGQLKTLLPILNLP